MIDDSFRAVIKEVMREVIAEDVLPELKRYDPEATMDMAEAVAYTGFSESYLYKQDRIKLKGGSKVFFKRVDLDALKKKKVKS